MPLGPEIDQVLDVRIADNSKLLGQLRVQDEQLEIGIEKSADHL